MSVSSTYADALYGAASDSGEVTAVAEGLDAFRAAYESNTELSSTLNDPKLPAASKKKVITGLTGGTSPLVGNFLNLLVDRGRISDLGALSDAFSERVAAAEGRMEITAITAVPLDDDLRATITERIKRVTGRDATLTEHVDEDIIGGLVLEVGGLRVDGSLRHRLDSLHHELTTTSVELPS